MKRMLIEFQYCRYLRNCVNIIVGRNTKGLYIMTNIKKELTKIWKKDSFISGQRCFWLYNYDVFRITDETEFVELNKNIKHLNKNVFAIADITDGDNQHTAYLYFDTKTNNDIFIELKAHYSEPKPLKKVANDLNEIFGLVDWSKRLTSLDDDTFWAWMEQSYHNYEIRSITPNGVTHSIDLRIYFKEKLKGTFLSDHKEVPIDAFKKYFEYFGVYNLMVEDLFKYRPTIDELHEFVNKINTQLGNKMFYVVSFNPSAFWGIGNFELLTNDEIGQLYNFGLID